jgi:DNA (cytosine-5)-methyltransferase 1
MHLFAGAGGGLLADLILGHRPIIAVEWDKYACSVLRERAADGWFPGLSVYEGDVRLFDPSEYKGRVDCIHAGFPCQDISFAGKQAGVGEETRSGLYREVLRIADVVRPRELYLENVSAILSNGLGTVLADLSERGYSARWICLRASDVGANHGRDRWWLLARRIPDSLRNGCKPKDGRGVVPDLNGINTSSQSERDNKQQRIEFTSDMGNTEHDGHPTSKITGSTTQGNDSNTQGQEQAEQPTRPSYQHEELAYSCYTGLQGCKITGNNGENRKESRYQQPSRCSSGNEWNETESLVGRVANDVADRVGKLKALGNGQVPLQAAVAYSMLSELFNT